MFTKFMIIFMIDSKFPKKKTGYAMEGEEEEEPERTLTVMGAAMNMTTTSIGAGIVNLPQATWDGGWRKIS